MSPAPAIPRPSRTLPHPAAPCRTLPHPAAPCPRLTGTACPHKAQLRTVAAHGISRRGRYDRIVQAPAATTAAGAGEAAPAPPLLPAERSPKAKGPRPTAALVVTGLEGDTAGAGADGKQPPATADGTEQLEHRRRKRRAEEEGARKHESKHESKPRSPAVTAASPRAKRPRDVSALDTYFTNGPRLQPASPDVPRRPSAR